MNTNTLLESIIAGLTLLYALRLVYLRMHTNKRKALLAKYDQGTQPYEMYQKIYSAQFLIAWAALTLLFVLNAAFDLYKNSHHISDGVTFVDLIVSIALSLCVLYFLFGLFRKK